MRCSVTAAMHNPCPDCQTRATRRPDHCQNDDSRVEVDDSPATRWFGRGVDITLAILVGYVDYRCGFRSRHTACIRPVHCIRRRWSATETEAPCLRGERGASRRYPTAGGPGPGGTVSIARKVRLRSARPDPSGPRLLAGSTKAGAAAASGRTGLSVGPRHSMDSRSTHPTFAGRPRFSGTDGDERRHLVGLS